MLQVFKTVVAQMMVS